MREVLPNGTLSVNEREFVSAVSRRVRYLRGIQVRDERVFLPKFCADLSKEREVFIPWNKRKNGV